MKRERLELELSKLYIELEQVERMSELEACEFGNTNSKQEYLECIQCEIDYYEESLRELESEDEVTSAYNLDPAFSSWSQVNSMFV